MLSPLWRRFVNFSFIPWIPVGFAAASAVAQVAILGILVKKRLRSDFRIFFTYNVSAVLITVLAVISYIWSCVFCGIGGGDTYNYIYWTMSTVLMVLEFGVMYEVFANIVRPYSALIDLGKMLFRWAGVFLLVGALVTALATVGPQSTKFMAAVTLMERSLRLMQCGLLLLFFLFERKLSLSWVSPNVSIALGLGTSAAMGLIISYLRTRYPESTVLGFVDNASYLAVVLFWAVCMALPQPKRRNVLDSPSRLIFQRWDEALQATPLVQNKGTALASVESFLPGIEKTVDRVMARKAVGQ
jgi:hypothetical protein